MQDLPGVAAEGLDEQQGPASFSPPAVLPAQAPVIISTMRMALEKLGQRSKSAVAKPVVEMMLAT